MTPYTTRAQLYKRVKVRIWWRVRSHKQPFVRPQADQPSQASKGPKDYSNVVSWLNTPPFNLSIAQTRSDPAECYRKPL